MTAMADHLSVWGQTVPGVAADDLVCVIEELRFAGRVGATGMDRFSAQGALYSWADRFGMSAVWGCDADCLDEAENVES